MVTVFLLLQIIGEGGYNHPDRDKNVKTRRRLGDDVEVRVTDKVDHREVSHGNGNGIENPAPGEPVCSNNDGNVKKMRGNEVETTVKTVQVQEKCKEGAEKE